MFFLSHSLFSSVLLLAPALRSPTSSISRTIEPAHVYFAHISKEKNHRNHALALAALRFAVAGGGGDSFDNDAICSNARPVTPWRRLSNS